MKIKLMDRLVSPPEQQTDGSAGYDLKAWLGYSNKFLRQRVYVEPGRFIKIGTGIKIYIEDRSLVGIVSIRSSFGKQGLTLANSIGVIDSDYQGEIILYIKNNSGSKFTIENGQRIAQIVFHKIETPTFEIVKSFEYTERGQGGFGSTGKD